MTDASPRTGEIAMEIAGERLILLPERAAWWPARNVLFVADVHLGKAAAFRAAAVPIPSGTTADNLERLTGAVERTAARRLIVLGDLFHARTGRTAALGRRLAAWKAAHADLAIEVVRGNHDVQAGDPDAAFASRVCDEPVREGPFVLRHHPGPSDDGYVLAGHLHPAAALTGPAGERLRMACFHFGQAVGVLPAFGAFTGTHRVRPRKGDRVFVCAPDRVLVVAGPE